MRLYDLALVMRSKNAGPFTLTIDLIFEKEETLCQALSSSHFNATQIAQLYNVPEAEVRIIPFRRALAIKVTLPRSFASSGAPGDRDVYGSGQHFPLGDIDI